MVSGPKSSADVRQPHCIRTTIISARVLLDLVKGLVLAFSCALDPEERKGFYEENVDVEDMIVRLSRPFLILC